MRLSRGYSIEPFLHICKCYIPRSVFVPFIPSGPLSLDALYDRVQDEPSARLDAVTPR